MRLKGQERLSRASTTGMYADVDDLFCLSACPLLIVYALMVRALH